MEPGDFDVLRPSSRLAIWLDTFFSGALEARARSRLASWRLDRVLRKHGEDSENCKNALSCVADAQFASEYWMDGSEKLRKEIYIALKSGVSHWDLRLLSLNGILVSREEELVVVSRWSLKHLTPVAILSCILACIALIGLTACSVAETWLKTALICLLAASLTYLSRKWHQRRSLISESRRRVIDYLKRRGPVPNVTRLPGRWPLVVIEPTWIPRSAESPTRSRYRNL